jgi:hypothetical protein
MGLETVSFSYTDPKAIDDSWWGRQPEYKDPKQIEITFFWPLTEQIPLELDYAGCAKPPTVSPYYFNTNGITTWTTGTTAISPQPQLTITPNNPVGTLSIGGVNIGLEKKPTWLQKQLHKLLGFNWKDK